MYVTRQIQNKLQKKKINLHQRSILREMMSTCDKLGNSFLTKQQSKKFDAKQKQQKQLSRKSNLAHKQHPLERFTHDPFKFTKDKITEDFVYVKESKQIKQIKDLKQKMLPKVNKTNIEKKLKELTYIRNMGFKTKNKKLESFKSLTRQKDEQNILNKSWQSFYEDKLYMSSISTPFQQEQFQSKARKKTRNPTYIIQKPKLAQYLQGKNINPSQVSQTLNSMETAPSFLVDSLQKSCQTEPNNFFIVNSSEKAQDLSLGITTPKQPRAIRVSTRNRNTFKEVLQSLPKKKKKHETTNQNLNPYCLSSERKKDITDKIGLNKEKLQKQNVFHLYSLIKGGYEMDRNDVEGQYISLKRFKDAKESFKILNTCFNKIRQYRYIVQQPQKVFNDGSFRSLVYLSQIQNKISPSQFNRIQKLNKVVD